MIIGLSNSFAWSLAGETCSATFAGSSDGLCSSAGLTVEGADAATCVLFGIEQQAGYNRSVVTSAELGNAGARHAAPMRPWTYDGRRCIVYAWSDGP